MENYQVLPYFFLALYLRKLNWLHWREVDVASTLAGTYINRPSPCFPVLNKTTVVLLWATSFVPPLSPLSPWRLRGKKKKGGEEKIGVSRTEIVRADHSCCPERDSSY